MTPLAWDPARQRAWHVGFGDASVDPRDEDMVDAADLSMTDATGAVLWHPTGLADIDAHPERTLTLWVDMRDGAMARAEPWQWWRVRGIPTAHQYPATPLGVPTIARCGYDPHAAGPVAEWTREGGTECGACAGTAKAAQAPTTGWGRIGDTEVVR